MRKSRVIKNLTSTKAKRKTQKDIALFERFLKENFYITIDVRVGPFMNRKVLGVKEFVCARLKGLVLYELVTAMQKKIKAAMENHERSLNTISIAEFKETNPFLGRNKIMTEKLSEAMTFDRAQLVGLHMMFRDNENRG